MRGDNLLSPHCPQPRKKHRDRQRSQRTENVIRKIKNGDIFSEKLSTYFCSIDFFHQFKKMFISNTLFFQQRGKKPHSI